MTRVTCELCGADSYQTMNYGHLQAANARFKRSLDKTAIELARANLRIMELEEREGFNTMKVRRQERALRALEAKLIRANVPPYATFPTAQEQIDKLVPLLQEARERLMISEGDARYGNANVEVALRIDAALGMPT